MQKYAIAISQTQNSYAYLMAYLSRVSSRLKLFGIQQKILIHMNAYDELKNKSELTFEFSQKIEFYHGSRFRRRVLVWVKVSVFFGQNFEPSSGIVLVCSDLYGAPTSDSETLFYCLGV